MDRRPDFRVFSDGITDLAPINADPISPKNLANGRRVFGLLRSNFTWRILGNSEPILPKIGHMGRRLRPSTVEFHRPHLPSVPILEWGGVTLMRARLLLRAYRRNYFKLISLISLISLVLAN